MMRPSDPADGRAPADAQAAGSSNPAMQMPSVGSEGLLVQLAQRERPPLVIDRRDTTLSPGSLARYVVTLAIWSLWAYFLMPLITLLLWTLGWLRFSSMLLTPEAIDLLEQRLPAYGLVVSVLCGGLIVWALASWWRFNKRERRRASKCVTTEALALRLGLDAGDLLRWQSARRIVVHHDSDGHPCGFEDQRPPLP